MYHLTSAVLVSTYVVCSTYVLLVVLMFLTLTQVLGTLHSKGSKKSKGVICLKEDPLKCGHLHRSWIHSDSSLHHFTFWLWNLRETSITQFLHTTCTYTFRRDDTLLRAGLGWSMCPGRIWKVPLTVHFRAGWKSGIFRSRFRFPGVSRWL